MARVLTAEQFQKCPSGTVFAFGGRWHFSQMLILQEVTVRDAFWYFYAIDPMWVDAEDSGEAIDRLEEMSALGVSYPSEMAGTKYASFDGDEMEVFFVLEASDWAAINAAVSFDIKEQ